MEKINSKIVLLSIAVIAVGLFAMPSTLSLFAGQHTFYNGSAVSCAKCHQDIINEAASQGAPFVHYTIMNATGNTGRSQCRVCHTTGTVTSIPVGKTQGGGLNATGSATLNVTQNASVHAAVTVQCISCHVNLTAELQGTSEAHRPFFNAASAQNASNGTAILKGANEACVGCHTHAIVNITWVRSVGYNMTVSEAKDGSYSINTTSVNASTVTTSSAGG